MKNLNFVAEQLFNQIRGRFPNITLGDTQGNITNEPQLARFFDFDYENEGKKLGKVSVSLDENDGIIVMYSKNFIENSFGTERANWFTFLKDMRMFSKKRLLNFEVRDINRSNLTKRDYKFLATNRTGDGTMNESMLYGKHRVSYQNIDNARLVIKHNENIDPDIPGSRTRNIKAIYVESPEGERFRYPYRHLSGARAMARHVSEGGHAYDDFGKYISSLSEELSKLRKFKTYMGRSSVMAESLSGYMDAVKDRISTVRKTIESLQKPTAYKEAFETFEAAVYEDVPDDVAENWIDQLTIKQFNEELKDVFPYIYRLVSEVTKAKEIGLDELIKENDALPQDFIYTVKPGDTVYAIAQKLNIDVEDIIEINGLDDNALIKVGQQLRLPDNPDSDEWRPHPTFGHRDQPGHPENKGLDEAGKLKGGAKDPCWSGYQMVGTKKKGGKTVPNCVPREEIELESGFERMMGQFGEAEVDEGPFKGLGKAMMKRKLKKEAEQVDEISRKTLQSYYSQAQDEFDDLDDIIAPDDPEEFYNSPPKWYVDLERKLNNRYKGIRQAQNRLNKQRKEKALSRLSRESEPLQPEKPKTPLGEFILSYFDRQTGQFPKGETAVLTMIEKDYGDQFIEPAKAFIERINNLVAEKFGFREPDSLIQDDTKNRGWNDQRRLKMYNPDGDMYMGKNMPGKGKTLSDPVDKAQNLDSIPKGSYEIDFDNLDREKLKKVVAKLIPTLGDKKIEMVLRARFGLEPFEKEYSRGQIAKAMGVTPEDIRNQEKKALVKLRHVSRARELRPFLDTPLETVLDVGESGLQYYTGKKKYGKEGMAALAQAGRNGASEEELGRIKDKYKKESEDIIRLSGLR